MDYFVVSIIIEDFPFLFYILTVLILLNGYNIIDNKDLFIYSRGRSCLRAEQPEGRNLAGGTGKSCLNCLKSAGKPA